MAAASPKQEHEAKRFALVVLQSTSLCNLNCRYCYVPDRKNSAVMSFDTLESVYRLTVGCQERLGITHEFLWHAGEPLTVGIDYMRKAVELCTAIALPDARFRFTIQTNGTLLTEKWARFLADWDFSVGVSIDGPHFLHDSNRVTWTQRDSLEKSRRGLDCLLEAGCRTGVLAVLTHDSLDYPDEIFDYFLESGVAGLGFNIEEIENHNLKTSFDAYRGKDIRTHLQRVRSFFDRLFERWWPHRNQLQIREFVDILRCAAAFRNDAEFVRQPDEARALGILTVTREGAVTTFSPEFAGAASEKYGNFVVGNVREMRSLDEILATEVFLALDRDIGEGLKACAGGCLYYPVCGGAFISNRLFEHGDFARPDTFTCISMRQTVADSLFNGLKKIKNKEETHR